MHWVIHSVREVVVIVVVVVSYTVNKGMVLQLVTCILISYRGMITSELITSNDLTPCYIQYVLWF